jgi:hypothetical protein
MRHDKLYPVIENSFAVVLPSRIDNFPNACIEAMAHHKIVVGTRNTGFEQLIEHRSSGFLCEKDNSSELLAILNEIIGLGEIEKRTIEENAFKRIQLLRPEITVNRLIDFYKTVIEKHLMKSKTDLPDFNQILNSELIDLIKKGKKRYLYKTIRRRIGEVYHRITKKVS